MVGYKGSLQRSAFSESCKSGQQDSFYCSYYCPCFPKYNDCTNCGNIHSCCAAARYQRCCTKHAVSRLKYMTTLPLCAQSAAGYFDEICFQVVTVTVTFFQCRTSRNLSFETSRLVKFSDVLRIFR